VATLDGERRKLAATSIKTTIFQIRITQCAVLATERLRNDWIVPGGSYISPVFFTLPKIFFEITLAQIDMYM
jgi:hypothetical protein